MSCFGSSAISAAKERYLQNKPEWTEDQKIIVRNTWETILKNSSLSKFDIIYKMQSKQYQQIIKIIYIHLLSI